VDERNPFTHTESKFSRTMMRQRPLIRSKKSEGESKGWERAADGQKDVNPPHSSSQDNSEAGDR